MDRPRVRCRIPLFPALTNDRSAAALGALFGGQSGAAGGVAVAADGSNINPVALAILNFKFPNGSYAIPNPQSISPSGVGQSSFSIPAHFREDQFSVNLDHKISNNNQLSGRFFYSRDPQHLPSRHLEEPFRVGGLLKRSGTTCLFCPIRRCSRPTYQCGPLWIYEV